MQHQTGWSIRYFLPLAILQHVCALLCSHCASVTDEEISVHSVWHLDQSCCINVSSLSTKWGKKFIWNIQVEAPQTPISFLHPKGKTHFKVLHIILPDSSFTLKFNEVQWNTTNREVQINAENTIQFFSKGWAEKQRGGGRIMEVIVKKDRG